MYKKAPQEMDYTLVEKFQKVNQILFIGIIVLTILSSLNASNVIYLSEVIGDIKNMIHIIMLISLAIISIIIEYNLLPSAQRTTRYDFIDHSFNTKFIHNWSSEDYYTNSNLSFGVYKMAVNLFESCLFTYTISSKMRFKKIIKCCLLIAVLVPLIFYGFKNTSLIGIVLLQAFLSIYFLNGMIRLLIFNNNNASIFNELKLLFANVDLKNDIDKYTAWIIKLYTDYESNKAWSYLHIDSKVYKEMNEKLSLVWEEMKIRYIIN